MDKKERNEALKLLAGGTIGLSVFFMIFEPRARANPIATVVVFFVIVAFLVAYVYGRQRGEAEKVPEESEEKDAFIGTAHRLGIDTDDKTREQIMDEIMKATTPNAPSAPQQVVKEIYKEREVITREIVKVRCRHCGYKFDEASNYCPHCGATS